MAKHITLMMIPDGAAAGRGIRLPAWALKLLAVVLGVVVIGILVFFALYSSVIAMAARADRLQRENERLLRYQQKVQLLEENLVQMRQIVSRLTELAGIDYKFTELPADSELFAELESQKPAVLYRASDADDNLPSGLPVQGFITQDFEIDDVNHFHPGVDIACAVGTPVLATAAGVVEMALRDSVYGWLLVIRHNDSMTTFYGHNETLLVSVGQHVSPGSRIALSGNTGVSSAPHLHYEVRTKDQPINPLEMMSYEKGR